MNNRSHEDAQLQKIEMLEAEVHRLRHLGLITIVVAHNGAVFLTISPNLVDTIESLSSLEDALHDALREVRSMRANFDNC